MSVLQLPWKAFPPPQITDGKLDPRDGYWLVQGHTARQTLPGQKTYVPRLCLPSLDREATGGRSLVSGIMGLSDRGLNQRGGREEVI